ncbi:YgdI/YgdR family lipoprotein [Pseudomonas sp. LS1212]|uniref:YgdI/YgdR family lipoprotein n=1 Tax=Pseudomonas sp. LS1212 TaxID=2972478 RepID=UPI00215BDE6F|nr:YgdI/YgdR family lipoprotein [Pseudomonas sp. LS1212]UVJ45685.1 YgdI/YgdR family lipoprotein [Pseudomonas sp. LS1212]
MAGCSLAGCSSSSVVMLQDGTQYVTKDSPRTYTRDGFVQFTDISGRHVRVRADEVANIKEED